MTKIVPVPAVIPRYFCVKIFPITAVTIPRLPVTVAVPLSNEEYRSITLRTP